MERDPEEALWFHSFWSTRLIMAIAVAVVVYGLGIGACGMMKLGWIENVDPVCTVFRRPELLYAGYVLALCVPFLGAYSVWKSGKKFRPTTASGDAATLFYATLSGMFVVVLAGIGLTSYLNRHDAGIEARMEVLKAQEAETDKPVRPRRDATDLSRAPN